MTKKKYDQCLEVSQDNTKYLELSIKRSKGLLPHMEVAKAFSKGASRRVRQPRG